MRRAAPILTNEVDLNAAGVRARYEDLIAEMTRDAEAAGSLREAVGHFLKVTRSYSTPDQPRPDTFKISL